MIGLYLHPPVCAAALLLLKEGRHDLAGGAVPEYPQETGFVEGRMLGYNHRYAVSLPVALDLAAAVLERETVQNAETGKNFESMKHCFQGPITVRTPFLYPIFLSPIEEIVPDGMDVLILCSSLRARRQNGMKEWIQNNPGRLSFTFTQVQWLAQAERFYQHVSQRAFHLGFSETSGVLSRRVELFLKTYAKGRMPFVWLADRSSIADKLKSFKIQTV
jgi:hypothetical protein